MTLSEEIKQEVERIYKLLQSIENKDDILYEGFEIIRKNINWDDAIKRKNKHIFKKTKFVAKLYDYQDINPNGFAICFSGGGQVAQACQAGAMNALNSNGLLNRKKINYISTDSGGTWTLFPSAFELYDKYNNKISTNSNINDMFVPYIQPSQLKIEQIRQRPSKKTLTYTASSGFGKALGFLKNVVLNILRPEVPMSYVVPKAISQDVLNNFSLQTTDFVLFVDSLEQINEYNQLNPQTPFDKYYLLRKDFPIPISTTTAAYPNSKKIFDKEKWFQMSIETNSYGALNREQVTIQNPNNPNESLKLNKRISTYAQNSQILNVIDDSHLLCQNNRKIEIPNAINYCGFSANATQRYITKIPILNSVNCNQYLTTSQQNIIEFDGGDFNNSAIIPILQKNIKKIIVYLVEGEKINESQDKYPKGLKECFYGDAQVFPSADFIPTVNGIKQSTNGVYTHIYSTINNIQNGIVQMSQVSVTWVVLVDWGTWFDQLPLQTKLYVKTIFNFPYTHGIPSLITQTPRACNCFYQLMNYITLTEIVPIIIR